MFSKKGRILLNITLKYEDKNFIEGWLFIN